MMEPNERACVLVFAGHDPSGGAGIQADIEAISAQGAHALPIVTALTVQDNNRVYSVHPVASSIIAAQARALAAVMPIRAIKFGIMGSRGNAQLVADLSREIQSVMAERGHAIEIVLDPVLASGAGHSLAVDEACMALQPLFEVASLVTPNLPELMRLASAGSSTAQRARSLLGGVCRHVLVKGGHADDDEVVNRWFSSDAPSEEKQWSWPRLSGSFHGSGCTLAAAIAGQLALGETMEESLFQAQSYTQRSLQHAYSIAAGQLVPHRLVVANR